MDAVVPVTIRPPAGKLIYHSMSSKRPPYCVEKTETREMSVFDVGVELFTSHHDVVSSDWPILTASSWDDGFSFWAQLVTDLSSKRFSFEGDVVPACTGIMYAFQRQSGWSIRDGMPMPIVDLALHWMPTGKLTAQKAWKADANLPTWSWLAWDGKVDYSLVLDNMTSYRFQSLKGRMQIGHEKRTTNVNSFSIHAKELDHAPAGGPLEIYRPSMLALKLKAWIVPAAPLEIMLVAPRGAESSADHENWRWLCRSGIAQVNACGIIFANNETIDDEFRSLKNLYFMLLSDACWSPFEDVARALAPEERRTRALDSATDSATARTIPRL